MRRHLFLFCLLFPLVTTAQTTAQNGGLAIPEHNGGQEAWLVTYAPGELYWQRFGHNAIWIRDPAMGLDHAFNFGYFDFEQENFISNFVRGRMMYFSLAIPFDREFEQYRRENRSIRAQQLRLDSGAFERLRNYLLEQIQPENRDYLYDYYLSNCSTRVRDVLDLALGGALARATADLPAAQNFRDHTRRSIEIDPAYYLGLEAVLGLPVDRASTRWEEMFLPSVVAEVLSEIENGGQSVVVREHEIFAGSVTDAPAIPGTVWWRYLLISAGFAVLIFGSAQLPKPELSEGLMLAWLMIAATGGLVLLALWALTDHQVASSNLNLLLLNPLLLLAAWPAARRLVAMLIMGGLVLAGGQWLLPVHQFNIDVLAFVLPLHLICAWWLVQGQLGLARH